MKITKFEITINLYSFSNGKLPCYTSKNKCIHIMYDILKQKKLPLHNKITDHNNGQIDTRALFNKSNIRWKVAAVGFALLLLNWPYLSNYVINCHEIFLLFNEKWRGIFFIYFLFHGTLFVARSVQWYPL